MIRSVGIATGAGCGRSNAVELSTSTARQHAHGPGPTFGQPHAGQMVVLVIQSSHRTAGCPVPNPRSHAVRSLQIPYVLEDVPVYVLISPAGQSTRD